MSNPTVPPSPQPSPQTAALPLADLAPGTWALDAQSSSVGFSNKSFWGLVTVHGTFTRLEGHATISAPGTGQGSVTIAAASLDTKNKKRDEHLRSKAFFDVENHPSITFTAGQVTPAGRDSAEVVGELTVRGVTKPLTVTARAAEATENAVTLTAELTVSRASFGVSGNQIGMIGDTAGLTLHLRFTRQ